MAKKNRIVSFNKMEPDLMTLVKKSFPLGFEQEVESFHLGQGRSFYAFPFVTDDCNYLIKVDIDLDFMLGWDEEEEVNNEDSDLD